MRDSVILDKIVGSGGVDIAVGGGTMTNSGDKQWEIIVVGEDVNITSMDFFEQTDEGLSDAVSITKYNLTSQMSYIINTIEGKTGFFDNIVYTGTGQISCYATK